MRMPIIVDETKCTGCGKCVDACHRLVYELQEVDGKKIAVPHREDYCLGCFLCVDPCPTGAIKLDFEKKREKEKENSI
jgi:NAD-dependent dihydropyrimidine dehydrogenase PreA subunit